VLGPLSVFFSTGLDLRIPDLPTGGHWTREIEFGPDDRLYVSIGSSCNICEEADARRAAVVSYEADGSLEETVGEGLRNSAGLAFQPETGELWASQNERDNLGDDLPAEELNILVPGGPIEHYGWPYCYGDRVPDPDHGSTLTYRQIFLFWLPQNHRLLPFKRPYA